MDEHFDGAGEPGVRTLLAELCGRYSSLAQDLRSVERERDLLLRQLRALARQGEGHPVEAPPRLPPCTAIPSPRGQQGIRKRNSTGSSFAEAFRGAEDAEPEARPRAAPQSPKASSGSPRAPRRTAGHFGSVASLFSASTGRKSMSTEQGDANPSVHPCASVDSAESQGKLAHPWARHLRSMPMRLKDFTGPLPAVAGLTRQGTTGTICSPIPDVSPTEKVIRKHVRRIQGGGPEPESGSGAPLCQKRVLGTLKALVPVAIVLSMLGLAASLDLDGSSVAWMAVEIGCTAVFVSEIAAKIWFLGLSEFLWGRNWLWNWMDSAATAVACVGITLTYFASTAYLDASRFTPLLRLFRIVRIVRMLRLLQRPFMRDLANMVLGLSLGAPGLFWVLALLNMVVGASAMLLRAYLGSGGSSPELLEKCGPGDNLLDAAASDEQCVPYLLLGQEYCGTMHKCMFTVFRCVTGDCTSKHGQSLAEHLSQGYGIGFEIAYSIAMTIVMFGLFNVITAVFVETMMLGLRYNETKRRIAVSRQAKFVERNLKKLDARVQSLHHPAREWSFRGITRPSSGRLSWAATTMLAEHQSTTGETTQLTQDALVKILQDEAVTQILSDLDIDFDLARGLFDMMGKSSQDTVGLDEVIDALMKMRGGSLRSEMLAQGLELSRLRRLLERLERRGVERLQPPPERAVLRAGIASPAEARLLPDCAEPAEETSVWPSAYVGPGGLGGAMDVDEGKVANERDAAWDKEGWAASAPAATFWAPSGVGCGDAPVDVQRAGCWQVPVRCGLAGDQSDFGEVAV